MIDSLRDRLFQQHFNIVDSMMLVMKIYLCTSTVLKSGISTQKLLDSNKEIRFDLYCT